MIAVSADEETEADATCALVWELEPYNAQLDQSVQTSVGAAQHKPAPEHHLHTLMDVKREVREPVTSGHERDGIGECYQVSTPRDYERERDASGERRKLRTSGYRAGRNREAELPAHLRGMMPPENTVNPEGFRKIVDLVLEFEDVFIGADGKVGYTNKVTHRIHTGKNAPVKC